MRVEEEVYAHTAAIPEQTLQALSFGLVWIGSCSIYYFHYSYEHHILGTFLSHDQHMLDTKSPRSSWRVICK